jgi:7-cyano-7-deazaguanine synthase
MPDHSPSPDRGAAVLVSGGIDSAVLTVELLEHYQTVHPIYVRFGLRWEDVELRHLREYLAAVSTTRPGLKPLTVLDEPIAEVYGRHWSNVGGPSVPGPETPDEAVHLPGRNVLLSAKAAVWCRLRGVETLAFGTLEANPFPDSTPGFFRDLEAVLNRALEGRLKLVRPYARTPKTEVIRRGAGLPLDLTFSCLDPDASDRHCGACNKCEERRQAFALAGLYDPTDYAASRSNVLNRASQPCIE